jgi:hypothetical protein
MKLVSLFPVKRGDWVIKASGFDDQILIFLWNEVIMESITAIFYSEEAAYNFIKRTCNDYSNFKTDYR